MSGFSINWLNLREDADRRARDGALLQRAMQWLETGQSNGTKPVIVDLGAGTGSTLRTFTDTKESGFAWRLVDLDENLLAEAKRRHAHSHDLETCLQDLSNIDSLPTKGARLITASALFDLVSETFVDELALKLHRQTEQDPVSLYAALNYDGTTHWTPAHPLDDAVLNAFNEDQRTDKGFGPALGPESGPYTGTAFAKLGFEVYSASSPWELDGADQAMLTELVTGIANAVKNNPSINETALKDWVAFRLTNLATGTCSIGHTDILALPR